MKKSIPFDFVLERLAPREPMVRPMFGCYAIYVDEKLVLILRERKDHPFDNGVWLATVEEFHDELKKIFPCMRSVRLLGGKRTVWQNLPVTDESFEELVLEACDMILRSDPRIGKIPGTKKRKTVRKR
jgi:hypothetical protein